MSVVDLYAAGKKAAKGNSPRGRTYDYSLGDIDPFISEIQNDVEEAIEFVRTELFDDLIKGLRYYNGEIDLPTDEGRSAAVATLVRDGVRNIKPSIMRVLCGSSSIVKYVPSNITVAAVIEQQEEYVHQLFWKSGGYELLLTSIDETLRNKFCPVKTYWAANVAPVYASLTMLTEDEIAALEEQPDIEILSVTDSDNSPMEGIDVFDVELEQSFPNGKAAFMPFPVEQFFISRNASNVLDARVHGQQRTATVAEAIELGIDYDDWWALTDESYTGQSGLNTERKKPRKDEESNRGDVLSHKFLLTEAYVQIDLLDAGTNQCYCVYLGGGDLRYLAHYREPESPIDIVCHDPTSFAVWGQSIADLLVQDQDVQSSLLRATIDNSHAANRPRLAGDPTKVNFDDLLNHAIDYPIRMKAGAQIQVVAIPSTLQASLPLLQWFGMETQSKLGITRAAQGLDPKAMQSTDKDAVKNTIALSQGQVELMVRNIIQTGLVPIFRKLLRLSIQHLDRFQYVRSKGQMRPIDQVLFDPNLFCEPVVGLGTADEEHRAAGLNVTLEKQLFILERLGMDNPFVSASLIYNTLEDITKLFGLHNVGRYWNLVTPEIEKQFKEKKQQEAAAAAAAQPAQGDPAAALVKVEEIKSNVRKFDIVGEQLRDIRSQQVKILEINAKDDFDRDKMEQERSLKSAEILGKTGVALDQNQIKKEQAAARDPVVPEIPFNGGNAQPAASPVEGGV